MKTEIDTRQFKRERLYTALKMTYGYEEFRPGQLEIIESIMDEKPTIAILPTGGGKSLCYMLPSVLMDGVVVVISPLIALMNDQVKACLSAGINSGTVHSGIDKEGVECFYGKAKDGWFDIVFVSPETILTEKFQKLISKISIPLWVFDEMHTMEMWGETFRPKYKEVAGIVRLHRSCYGSNVAAFTASATPELIKYTQKTLDIEDCKVFKSSFYRENLKLLVIDKEHDWKRQVSRWCRTDSKGLVYCTTRADTERIATYLMSNGLQSASYHAGKSTMARTVIEDRFKNGEIKICCCTIAFGMGIDIPDINYVIHADMPKNVEGYYQEIGRAGRGGQVSHCTLLYDRCDYAKHVLMNEKSEISEEYKEISRKKITQMMMLAETDLCLWNGVLNYFDEYATLKNMECGTCSNCKQKEAHK